MIGWFIWNDRNSESMGLWVSDLPPIVRAEERSEKIEVPGRSGSLVLSQGEDVYNSYVKECRVSCRRDMDIQPILNWLRGDGVAIFGNEPNKTYKGRILSEVRFEKVSNDIIQAVIPFYVEPFKGSRYPNKDSILSSESSFSLHNPGDVASFPTVKITGTGNNVVSFGNHSMSFSGISGTIVVDCGAQIITSGNDIWNGTFSGEFWKIPTGDTTVTQTGNMTIEIIPDWRWV